MTTIHAPWSRPQWLVAVALAAAAVAAPASAQCTTQWQPRGLVQALAFGADGLYVAGTFTSAGNQQATGIARLASTCPASVQAWVAAARAGRSRLRHPGSAARCARRAVGQ